MGIPNSLAAEIGIVILISTTHLRKKTGKVGKTISSLLLFVLIALVIDSHSGHLCDEGNAPYFIKFGFGAIGAALPWGFPANVWLTRVAVIPIIFVGGFIASFLTASYHRDDITGNRDYSCGWFWHTPFTGQYPRNPDATIEKRQEEMERIFHEFREAERSLADDTLPTGSSDAN